MNIKKISDSALLASKRAFIRFRNTATFTLFSLSIISCSHLSLNTFLSHYTADMNDTREALKQGDAPQALLLLPQTDEHPILTPLERGRLQLLSGHHSASLSHLKKADSEVKSQQGKALIQVSTGIEQTGAILFNDNLIKYTPADYELGFMHLYLILGYLQAGDLNAALVEVRRANQVQENAMRIREKELNIAAASIQRQGIQHNLGAILSRYPNAGQKLVQVQNGYLLFVSGLLYELSGNLNGAYIDFSRALAVYPKNKFIAQSLMRVVKKQGRTETLNQLTLKYGALPEPLPNQGQIIVLIENDVIQSRQAWQIPLLLPYQDNEFISSAIALPFFPGQSLSNLPRLTIDCQIFQPSMVANLNEMAQNALSESLPMIAVRQILRTIAKHKVNKEIAENDASGVAVLFSNVINYATEQPDTRHWQTLPETVGLIQGYFSQGQHEMSISEQKISIRVKKNKTTLVWLSRQNNHVASWQKVLGDF